MNDLLGGLASSMAPLSTAQLITVAIVGLMAFASTGLILLIGVVHLKEKYWPKPPATGAKR